LYGGAERGGREFDVGCVEQQYFGAFGAGERDDFCGSVEHIVPGHNWESEFRSERQCDGDTQWATAVGGDQFDSDGSAIFGDLRTEFDCGNGIRQLHGYFNCACAIGRGECHDNQQQLQRFGARQCSDFGRSDVGQLYGNGSRHHVHSDGPDRCFL